MSDLSKRPAGDETGRYESTGSLAVSPAVSVVMAVRDGERFLEIALRSILSQTLKNLELIVIDDGSRDGTPQIIEQFRDARIRTVAQPGQGLAAALNRGVSLARTDLIARMDADDISMPERLESQLNFMEANPLVGLIGSATQLINEEGQQLRTWEPPVSDKAIRASLIRANQFAHPTVMFRTRLFNEVGGYSEMPFAQDYDLWLRMASRCEVANLPQILLQRRETAGQFGTERETRQIRWAMRARIAAVRRGDYSKSAVRHMIKPAVAAITPASVRELTRKVFRLRAA